MFLLILNFLERGVVKGKRLRVNEYGKDGLKCVLLNECSGRNSALLLLIKTTKKYHGKTCFVWV